MFVQTHESVAPNGDVFQVYRDRAAGLMVKKFTAHRGGCLYLGEISIVNTQTCEAYEFTSTSGPWGEAGASSAASYMRRHAAKVSATY